MNQNPKELQAAQHLLYIVESFGAFQSYTVADKHISQAISVGGTGLVKGSRGSGIVLGLYIAALLLMGPLHFLMHPTTGSGCGVCEKQTTAFDSFQPGKTGYDNPHHCPACFLHSHAVAGEQNTPHEASLNADSDALGAFTEYISDAQKTFSLRNRAPPFVL